MVRFYNDPLEEQIRKQGEDMQAKLKRAYDLVEELSELLADIESTSVGRCHLGIKVRLVDKHMHPADLICTSWCKGLYDPVERGTMLNVELTSGDFHSGSTFRGSIELEDPAVWNQLVDAAKRGYYCSFMLKPLGDDL